MTKQNNGGKHVKAPSKPKTLPSMPRPEGRAAVKMYHSDTFLKKQIDRDDYVAVTTNDPSLAEYAREESKASRTAMGLKKQYKGQLKGYAKDALSRGANVKKYADGTSAVSTKKYYNSAGQEIKRGTPVAPAYTPSNQITARPSGGAALNIKEGGDPMKKGRDLSGYVSGVNTKKQVVAGTFEKGGVIGKIFKGKKAKDAEARDTKSNELAAKTKEGLAKISAPKVESTKDTGVSFKSEAVEYKPKYDTSKGGTVAVAKYQEKLNKETGSKLKVDGIWGDKTDKAYSKSLVKKNKESKVTAQEIGATEKSTANKNKAGGTQHGDNVFYDNGRVHNTKTGKSGNWKQGEGSKRHITYATKTTSNKSGKQDTTQLPSWVPKGDTAQNLAERAGRYGDNDDAGFAVGKGANEVRREGQGKGWGISEYVAAGAGVGIAGLGVYATKRAMKMSKPMTAKGTTIPMTASTSSSSTAPTPTGYARPVARQHGPMQATTNKQLKNGVVATNNKGKAVKPSNFEKVSNNIKNAKNSFKDKSNVNMAKFERAEMQSRMRASERLEKAEVKPMSKSTTSKGKKTTSKKK